MSTTIRLHKHGTDYWLERVLIASDVDWRCANPACNDPFETDWIVVRDTIDPVHIFCSVACADVGLDLINAAH